MLTPLDIHNKEFKKVMRGYSVDEVDGFLDEIIRDFEFLFKQNMEYEEALKKSNEQIEYYRSMEDTLQNTMVLAQKMAEESKRNAEKETELVIWEARKKAEQIVGDAHDEVTETIRKVERLKAYEKQIKAKLHSFLHTQIQLVADAVIAEDNPEGDKDLDELLENY